RGRRAERRRVGPALDIAVVERVAADASRSCDPSRLREIPVGPVRAGGGTKAAVGNGGRLTIELADGVGPAAPAVYLGWLARLHAGKLQQGEATDGLLRELDAFPEHARARPSGTVLDHERGAMGRCMRGRVPQHA